MPQVHHDGYYATGPVPWEEWHAGVRMHGIRRHYLRFYDNGMWLQCDRDEEFDFWAFTESVTEGRFLAAQRGRAPRIGDQDPDCTAGSYTLKGEDLVRRFAPDFAGGFVWEWRLRLLDDRLVSETGATWLFQPRPL